MWTQLAHIILKFRLPLLIFLGIVTIYMGYRSQEAELSYNIGKIIPANDPEMVYYNEFRKLFGEDGNILVIGVKDSSLFELDNFTKFKYLNDELASLEGVSNVL